jgi:hypothetical protein
MRLKQLVDVWSANTAYEASRQRDSRTHDTIADNMTLGASAGQFGISLLEFAHLTGTINEG